MPLEAAEAFQLLKTKSLINLPVKERPHFWYGPGPKGPTLLVDKKSKIAPKDILAVNGNKAPAAPLCCRGRIGLTGGVSDPVLHAVVIGAVPTKFGKDLKALAKDNGLPNAGIQVDDGLAEDPDGGAEAADTVTKKNHAALAQAIGAALQKSPAQKPMLEAFGRRYPPEGPLSSDELAKALDELATLAQRTPPPPAPPPTASQKLQSALVPPSTEETAIRKLLGSGMDTPEIKARLKQITEASEAATKRKPAAKAEIERLVLAAVTALKSGNEAGVEFGIKALNAVQDDFQTFAAEVDMAVRRARDRRPDAAPQISQLMQTALTEKKQGNAQGAKAALDSLNALWNDSVVSGGTGGDSLERDLLAAAKAARLAQPQAAQKIAELSQRGRDLASRGTKDDTARARAIVEELKVYSNTSATPDAAKQTVGKALQAFRMRLGRQMQSGPLALDDMRPKVRAMTDLASKADREIAVAHYDLAQVAIDEAEKLLDAALQEQYREDVARRIEKPRIEALEKEHAKAQQRIDKLGPKGLAKDYKETRTLGQGAFGTAVLLESKSGEAPLVFKKVTLPDYDPAMFGGEDTPYLREQYKEATRDDRERIEREGAISKEVGVHPNIAQYYGTVQVGDQTGMLLEAVDGKDMKKFNDDLLKKRERGEISETEYWGAVQFTMSKTLEALEFLEQKGYSHNDLKPENIMIDGNTGEPKLIDLGSMRKVGEKIGPGTPAFDAPDEPGNLTSTTRDPFSLGASAYQVGAQGEPKDFGGGQSNPSSFWQARNVRAAPGGDLPQDWRQLSEPAIKVQPDTGPGGAHPAYTTTTTVQPGTAWPGDPNPPQPHQESSANPVPGVQGADTAYVDFVNRLMHPDPRYRMSASEARQHPFMQQRLMNDADASNLVKGLVKPPADPEESAKQQAKRLAELDKTVRAALKGCETRVKQLDGLLIGVRREIEAIASGTPAKPKGEFADPKLLEAMNPANGELGQLGQLLADVRTTADGLPKEQTQPVESLRSLQGEIEIARNTLNGTLSQLAQALKARRTAKV